MEKMKKSEMYERFIDEYNSDIEILEDYKAENNIEMISYIKARILGTLDLANVLNIINDKEWSYFYHQLNK